MIHSDFPSFRRSPHTCWSMVRSNTMAPPAMHAAMSSARVKARPGSLERRSRMRNSVGVNIILPPESVTERSLGSSRSSAPGESSADEVMRLREADTLHFGRRSGRDFGSAGRSPRRLLITDTGRSQRQERPDTPSSKCHKSAEAALMSGRSEVKKSRGGQRNHQNSHW